MRVHIDRIAPEGEGIGRAEGSDKVVFVPHALPGEVVEGASMEEKPHYRRARLENVLHPSPARILPKCPYHFRPGAVSYCGGCDWQHATYEMQLRLKREIVEDCMARIAKLRAPVLETLAAPSPWRYRNKVQIPFQSGPGVLAGFYVPGTHHLIDIEDCWVQPEVSVAILNSVKELAGKFRWRMYDEERGEGWLRHLLLRTNAQGEVLVAFVTRATAFPQEREAVGELLRRHPQVVSLWQNVQREKTSVILGPRWRRIWGRERFSETIGRLRLEYSPGAFLQIHTPAAEILYRVMEEFIFEEGFQPQLALDVYSGIGPIGFWIAPRVPRILGVEESRQAVVDAHANARRLGISHIRFVCARASVGLGRLEGRNSPRPWVAVLDPPRSGCEPEVLGFLSDRRVERVVYVSCNPATFARDARRLCDRGYHLEKIQPVDLFPQTSHVELVAKFNYLESTGLR